MSVSQDYNAALAAQVTTTNLSQNYLKPQGFKFVISSMPAVNFTCQVTSMPAVALGYAEQKTPLYDIPLIGDKLTWSQLDVQFILMDDLSNYKAIFNWMVSISGKELEAQQTKDWRQQLANFPQYMAQAAQEKGLYSDATMFIMDAQNNPTQQISYFDIFPIGIRGVPFDITQSSQEPLTAVASFRYREYTFG